MMVFIALIGTIYFLTSDKELVQNSGSLLSEENKVSLLKTFA